MQYIPSDTMLDRAEATRIEAILTRLGKRDNCRIIKKNAEVHGVETNDYKSKLWCADNGKQQPLLYHISNVPPNQFWKILELQNDDPRLHIIPGFYTNTKNGRT
jgi:hypothetical protein